MKNQQKTPWKQRKNSSFAFWRFGRTKGHPPSRVKKKYLLLKGRHMGQTMYKADHEWFANKTDAEWAVVKKKLGK